MGEQIPYLTRPIKLVLQAMLDTSEPVWNLGLAQKLGLPQPTVNQILHRLGDSGLASSTPEEHASREMRAGHRLRLLWELTDEGRQVATERLAKASERRLGGRVRPDEMSSRSVGVSQTEEALQSLMTIVDELMTAGGEKWRTRGQREELEHVLASRLAREGQLAVFGRDSVAHRVSALRLIISAVEELPKDLNRLRAMSAIGTAANNFVEGRPLRVGRPAAAMQSEQWGLDL